MFNRDEFIEDMLDFMKRPGYKPLDERDLLDLLFVPAVSSDTAREAITGLENSGVVMRSKKGKLYLPEQKNLQQAKLQGNRKGFAFALSEVEGMPDIFISEQNMHGALHGDRVLVRILPSVGKGKKTEGEIYKVLERVNQSMVGTYKAFSGYALFIPDEMRINGSFMVDADPKLTPPDGSKVVVEVTQWGSELKAHTVKVTEVLGNLSDPGVDVLSIIRKFQFPDKFPDVVIAAAEQIPTEVQEKDIVGREDLRDKLIVTIDGADAKDLDDAVSVEKDANGNWVLGVHIADVSNYVELNGPIDKEVFKRATSVYLVDRVIPMLPERLSNGVCSLNPSVDRLTMSCFMTISSSGEVLDHRFARSVINSKHRMVYTEVNDVLAAGEENIPEALIAYKPHFGLIKDMAELADILSRKRTRRGAIDFNFPETKVKLNAQGKAIDVYRVVRGKAEAMIEQFMIEANETVAKHLNLNGTPGIYRVHEKPNDESMMKLTKFLSPFGLALKGWRDVHPKALQQVLVEAQALPNASLISTVMLRSLKRARYAGSNLGHFGLAAEYYTHFTSPIRRFPDLIIHRLLKTFVVPTDERYLPELPKITEYIALAAVQSSEQEREAEDAERESLDMKIAEFMHDKIGEAYDGEITGVTNFGIFVMLENGAEGLVPIESMADDYYVFDEINMTLRGERNNKEFTIGDKVGIVVVGADAESRRIEFMMPDTMRKRDGLPRVARTVVKRPEAARPAKASADNRPPWQKKAAKGSSPARKAGKAAKNGGKNGGRGKKGK